MYKVVPPALNLSLNSTYPRGYPLCQGSSTLILHYLRRRNFSLPPASLDFCYGSSPPILLYLPWSLLNRRGGNQDHLQHIYDMLCILLRSPNRRVISCINALLWGDSLIYKRPTPPSTRVILGQLYHNSSL